MECPHIPEIQYSDFSKRLHEKVAGQRIPINGSLELTFRCNLRCVHCYAAHGHQGIPGKQELTFAEICGILDQIVDEGCLWLLLTGGEPLLRPDFLDIYTYAKRKGLLVTLFTNGTLITPRIADYLADWRPLKVEITLYGRTQETYEARKGEIYALGRARLELEHMHNRGALSQRNYEILAPRLQDRLNDLNIHLHEIAAIEREAVAEELERAEERLLHAEKDGIKEAYLSGVISERVMKKLLSNVDDRLFSLETSKEEHPSSPDSVEDDD